MALCVDHKALPSSRPGHAAPPPAPYWLAMHHYEQQAVAFAPSAVGVSVKAESGDATAPPPSASPDGSGSAPLAGDLHMSISIPRNDAGGGAAAFSPGGLGLDDGVTGLLIIPLPASQIRPGTSPRRATTSNTSMVMA